MDPFLRLTPFATRCRRLIPADPPAVVAKIPELNQPPTASE
jgi:hypothetical protein